MSEVVRLGSNGSGKPSGLLSTHVVVIQSSLRTCETSPIRSQSMK